MNFEEAFRFADRMAIAKTGKHLNDVQRAVIWGTWQGQKYAEIAQDYHCTPEYLKQDVGPNLWKLISEALGVKVNKKNFKTVLELHYSQPPPPSFYSLPSNGQGIDWGEAPDVPFFYGRKAELLQLEKWVVWEGARVVALLGMGGIGKTTLSVKLAEEIQYHFDFVCWRSLRNSPPLPEILTDIIRFISNSHDDSLPEHLNRQISRLIELMRCHRCLIILDNIESILQPINLAGRYYPGYENYGELFKRLGETNHQSCLILTSREKPKEIATLGSNNPKVRCLQLRGLEDADCQEIFSAKGLSISAEIWQQLVGRYAGNPLALKIVTTTIQDLFGGNIADFLEHIEDGIAVFGDLSDLLEQQLARLSNLEMEIMYWLAINREPISIAELQKDIISPVSPTELIESLESLTRRSLVENNSGKFTQQPVVMEYTLKQLIEKIVTEIDTENPQLFRTHALVKAQAKDYIRESQIRVILQPIAQKLANIYRFADKLEIKIKQILSRLKNSREFPGYGGGNLINLCDRLKIDLSNYDFSELPIWQAYLQDMTLHNVNFAGADLSKSVFAKTLGNYLAVAFCNNEKFATADAEGRIFLWQVTNAQQLLAFGDGIGAVRAIVFSRDGKILATGGDDRIIRLWDTATGECIDKWERHSDRINCIDFSADGELLASGSDDGSAKLWVLNSGQCLKSLEAHTSAVRSLSFSPEKNLLATCGDDQTAKLWNADAGECLSTFISNTSLILAVGFVEDWEDGEEWRAIACSSDDRTVRLWDIETGECAGILEGHADGVWEVAFSADGRHLATSSDDRTVKLWETHSSTCIKTLFGFESQVWSAAFSPNGELLVTGNVERIVQLWDVAAGRRLRSLRGHTHQVWCFAISPGGEIIATGSDDRLARLWDARAGRCLRSLRGHQEWVWSIAFSPDGEFLASCSYDRSVKLWKVETGECLQSFLGHSDRVQALAFSPNGQILASASDDGTIKLWDVRGGECLHTLTGHTRWVVAIAFSPDGRFLASGSQDRTLKLWDVKSGAWVKSFEEGGDRVRYLAFSSGKNAEMVLASCSEDRVVKLWSVSSGQCVKSWLCPREEVRGLCFESGDRLLVTASEELEVELWDGDRQKCLQVFSGHQSPVWSVHLNDNAQFLVSGSHDRQIKIWDVNSGECLKTFRTDLPYDGMNISEVRGITAAVKATLKGLGAIER
jgi:WD40 repeat protein